MTADGCEHLSADGVDQVPLDDPAKVWRCCSCGATYQTVIDERGFARQVPVNWP